MPRGAGNGRAVRNLIEAVFRRYAKRLVVAGKVGKDDPLLVSDFEQVLGDVAEERLGPVCKEHGVFTQVAGAVRHGLGRKLVAEQLGEGANAAKALERIGFAMDRVAEATQTNGVLGLDKTKESCNARAENVAAALHDRRLELCGDSGVMEGLSKQLLDPSDIFKTLAEVSKTLAEEAYLSNLRNWAEAAGLPVRPAGACAHRALLEDGSANINFSDLKGYVDATCLA